MKGTRLGIQRKGAAAPSFIPARNEFLQGKCAYGGTPGPTDEGEACRKKELQRRSNNLSNPSANHPLPCGNEVPPIVHEVLRSPGQSLDEKTRAFMEPRFGHDFSSVRVHTDERAAQSAQAVNSLAYTVGRDVVFGAQQYAPSSPSGRRLLAHELTHVLQHTQAGGTSASEEAAEKEANRNAVTSPGSSTLAVKITAPGKMLQRQPATADAGSTDAPTDIEKVVRAADRARREPTNATTMMINGSEIVYRLIHEFLPDYDSKVSGVSYRANLKEISVQPDGGSISITVGNEFILGTNEGTIEKRALELGGAIFAKMPRPQPPKKLPGLLGSMAIESKKDPIKGPESANPAPAPPELSVATTFGLEVPGLGPDKRPKVEELIKNKDIQGAINMIVQYGGVSGGANIDTSLLAGGQMKYDSGITSEDAVTGMASWDYSKNKAEPANVRIGQKAFSSVPYLYSVIMHEYQHVLWNQNLKNQEIARETHEEGRQGGGMYTSEVEAYAWELLHAEESGLSKIPEKIAGVWGNLNEEFWKTDPAAQTKIRPKVQSAWIAANRFVKGTDVKLDPFAKP